MIEIKKLYNLILSINEYLAKKKKELGLSDAVSVNARVLLQEKDGIVIYTWNDLPAYKSKVNSPVTHIGLYDPISQQHEVVWVHDSKVTIVSCSINQEKTLLAFTTETKQKKGAKAEKEIYEAYLAELHKSESRVFSLNFEKPRFIKVQFLYASQGEQTSAKESFLLVFLHKESVGLYRIPLAQLGDRGIFMRDQPKTEQLIRKFVWCEWDAQNQRLHYIYNSRHDNSREVCQKFSSIQFYQNAKHDSMLDLPLNFPFPFIRSSSRSRYADRPLSHGIPDVAVNVSVLTQSNGTFCICYQEQNVQTSSSEKRSDSQTYHDDESINYYICMVHHAKTIQGCVSGISKQAVGTRRLSFHWMGDYLMVLLPGFFVHLLNVSIEYEPCHHIMLHNEDTPLTSNLTLSQVVPSCDPSPVSFTSDVDDGDTSREHKTTTVRFQDQDSGALASPEPVSTHQLRDHGIPDKFSVISDNGRKVYFLSSCIGFGSDVSNSSVCVYDYHSGWVFRLSVSLDDVFHCFKTAYWTTQQALLHYLLLRTKDLFTLRKVFAEICRDVTSSEISTAMAEFLITTTYNSMKRQLGREVLCLLPFTAVDTFRGQFVRNASGERLARLSYTSLGSININTKTAHDRMSRKMEDLWDLLRRHLRLRQIEAPKRFQQDKIKGTFSQHIRDDKRMLSWEYVKREQSFLVHIPGTSNRQSMSAVVEGAAGRPSRIDAMFGAVPAFLQGGLGEDTADLNILRSLTENVLTAHLAHHLKKDSRVKAQNIAKEYVSCQMQQTRQLCHMLWSIAAHTTEECRPDLCEPGSDEEYELFQLLERFYLTVSEKAFPLPPGFRTYFTTLGFRCMHLNLFLQYVDRGVVELTGDFVSQLLKDVPDDGDNGSNVKLKYQIVSRLPKAEAEECFQIWNHPLCSRYFAHHQVAKILLGNTSKATLQSSHKSDSTQPVKVGAHTVVGDNLSTASESSVGAGQFPPLTAFIQYLERKTEESHNKKVRPGTVPSTADVDSNLLEEVGLYHTRQIAQYDMSTVNF